MIHEGYANPDWWTPDNEAYAMKAQYRERTAEVLSRIENYIIRAWTLKLREDGIIPKKYHLSSYGGGMFPRPHLTVDFEYNYDYDNRIEKTIYLRGDHGMDICRHMIEDLGVTREHFKKIAWTIKAQKAADAKRCEREMREAGVDEHKIRAHIEEFYDQKGSYTYSRW